MMIFLLGAALALNLQVRVQVQVGSDDPHRPVVRDSLTDTTGARGDRGVRKPVTAEVLATAFKDSASRRLLFAARRARLSQDSSLHSYDAMTYQRISAGIGLTKFGRDRLLFRHENAARVRWQQGVGAWVDMKGVRTAMPVIGDDKHNEIRDDITSDPDIQDMNESATVPYFPGYEPLWVGSDVARAQVNERELVHPIADGAEAYYTYQTGDSITFRLPDGKTIHLRELKVRPREPRWNLAVGSLWFDTKSGQLVRAAYRLSIPIDIWAVAQEEDSTTHDDAPAWVKGMLPMKAEVTTIAVEYSLHDGRFWLPRMRLAEGSAQVSFMRFPFKMEEAFKYASVNGPDTLPHITPPPKRAELPDSLSDAEQEKWRDSVRTARREHNRAVADSVRQGLIPKPPREKSQCDTAAVRVTSQQRYDSELLVATRMPCDLSLLEHSPDLPPSIYDPGDVLFGDADIQSMKEEALSLAAQAPFSVGMHMLPPPTISYGPSMMRYNRVEGLSLGASVDQQLGGGYDALAVARFGFADLEPNAELTLNRTNLRETIGVSAYNRLVSASDWGHPLSFGSSFSALMFGRDEGFYYRATGGEVHGTREASFGGGTRLDWRAFVEQERTAAVNTNFAVNGADFPANLLARRGMYTGLGARVSYNRGLDPKGLRLFTDMRFEAAAGDSLYGRGAADVTLTHGLGRLAGALTLSGGSSVGGLPPQRAWYLGGSQTVRGQSPDTAQSGNAYWLTRAEIGSNQAGFRPTVFADLGWVGDRAHLRDVGRPLSGVGAGVSFLDGLVRFDVARGLYPRKQTRVDVYLEAKF